MKLSEIILKKMQRDLVSLCKRELNIAELPQIVLIDDDSINGKSFGEFDGQTIKVVAKNRHPMDVMRTLAHELAHYKQMADGKEMNGSTGSDIENEANAVAGIILRKFGRLYPEYFKNN